MLSIEDFIIMSFCYVDDYFKELSQGQKLRGRGFDPALSDTEVITMEIVGEYLGIDTDRRSAESRQVCRLFFLANLEFQN